MTVCIAAQSKDNYVVVASDRMVTLTLPSTEFEQGSSKTLELTKNCLAATAGSALAYTPIHVHSLSGIKQNSTQEIAQIAEINRQNYVIMRNSKIEQVILAKFGITLQDFYNMNRQLAPEIVAHITQAMGQFEYELSILIAGILSNFSFSFKYSNMRKNYIFTITI